MEILDYTGTEVLHRGNSENFDLKKKEFILWVILFLFKIGQLNFLSLHYNVFIVPLKVP